MIIIKNKFVHLGQYNLNTTIMKNFLMLAVAMLLSWSIAFAATQSPFFQKGKYYGKQVIVYALNGQAEDIEHLCEDIEAYMDNNIETEDQLVSFIDGIKAGLRQGCQDAGLDKETTEVIVKSFEESLLAALE